MATASEIRHRFFSEQDYIQRYVRLLEAKATLRQAEVRDVANLLSKYRLPTIPIPLGMYTRGRSFSAEESANLRGAIKSVRPALETALSIAEKEFQSLATSEDLGRVDLRSIVGEWIQYFLDELESVGSTTVTDSLRQHALEQIQHDRNELGDESDVPTADDIDYAIRSAEYLASYRKFDAMAYVVDKFTEFELTLRLTELETEVSILRQGFVLLMTTFDAAVFDLIRVAVRNDFFGAIGTFSTGEKLSLDTFGKYKDFESFRDSLIENQLKGQYLKDLLFRLKKLKAICGSDAETSTFAQLIELVNRRNIHIHNRGIVDERYLERDELGSSKFNIYNLKLGDNAVVDEKYWSNANSLCQNCIQEITLWTEQRSSTNLRD
jgi:hypothetical protein